MIKCLYCMTIRCQNRCLSSDTADSESALDADEFRRRSLQQQQQRQRKHLDEAQRSNTGRYSGMMWNESRDAFSSRLISEVTYVICNMLAPKVLSGRKVKTYKHINPGSPWFTCWEWDTHEIQHGYRYPTPTPPKWSYVQRKILTTTAIHSILKNVESPGCNKT